MKILRFYAENVKRIKAIDITPTDDLIIISGKNENGKSSVLDSIWLALEYRAASKENPVPLRIGQDKGIVELDLGDYIATRKFTKSGTTLEIRTPDGSKIPSPQKLLDGMYHDLSFDPWEFARKDEKTQRQMLADVLYNITEGKLDLADFDAKYKEAYDSRTELNREKKRLSTLITQLAPPTGADPTEEISASDITDAISDAMATEANFRLLGNRAIQLDELVRKLEKELEAARKEQELVTQELTRHPKIPNIDLLKQDLANLEMRNKRAREVKEYTAIRTTLDKIESEVEALNDKMELIDIEKSEALEDSPLPISGLKITEDGIMILNEEGYPVPFCQASAARRLKVSLAIAMAGNPKLRVIRISDGSLLDDESMDIIKQMIKERDYQIWIEYMSRNDQDRMGVYIRDGEVAVD